MTRGLADGVGWGRWSGAGRASSGRGFRRSAHGPSGLSAADFMDADRSLIVRLTQLMLCLCLPYRCPPPLLPSRNAAAHVATHATDPACGVHASCTSLSLMHEFLGFRATSALQVRPGGRGANVEVLVPTEAPFILAGPTASLRPELPDAALRYPTVPYEPVHAHRLSTAHAVSHRPPRPRRRTYGSARSA